jgi:hypothetical protein
MSELLDQTKSCTGNNVGHSNDGLVVEGSPGAGSRATIKPLPKCEVAAVATRNHCVAYTWSKRKNEMHLQQEIQHRKRRKLKQPP